MTPWREQLARELNRALVNRTQAEAAALLGVPQPRVSQLRNYDLQGISAERLMGWLVLLGYDVEIRVTDRYRDRQTR